MTSSSKLNKLKARARRHEQDEAWQEALDAYQQVIRAVEADGSELELGIYNRVGDLLFRLGRQSEAAKHYRMAADRYAEAGLLNNAIALCNKVMRQIPDQKELLLKIGRFSASQGFLTDARRAFLEYAEVKSDAGEMEAAFAALAEFAELAEDAEVREMLAERLTAHGDAEGAVEQLVGAYELRRRAGEVDQARAIRDRIEVLAPEAVPAEPPDQPGPAAEPGTGGDASDEASPWTAGTAPGAAAGGDGPSDDAAPSAGSADGLPVESAADAVGIDQDGTGAAGGPGGRPAAGAERRDDHAGVEPLPLLDMGESDAEDSESRAEAGPREDAGRADAESAATERGESADDRAAESLPLLDIDDPTDLSLDTEATEEGAEADVDEDAAEPAMAEDRAAAEERAGTSAEAVEEPGAERGAGPEPERAAARETRPAAPPEPIDPAADALKQAGALVADGRREAAIRLLDDAHRVLARAGRLEDALRVADEAVALDADRVGPYQARVEYAYRLGDATRQVGVCLDLADALSRAGAERKAAEVYRRVLDLDPSNATARAALRQRAPREPAAASSPGSRDGGGSFVDLGALLDEEPDETSTRFVVPHAAPTGDEERDFADMLARFKTKVAENVAEEDVASHYDLGLAFKEMGLLDEAIGEFQTALRGGEDGDRLKVYEELGECFIIREQHNVAVKVLQRALQLTPSDEEEMIGIFYHLGRCYEALGRPDEARDAYERVVGLDVRFRDVSERIAGL